MVSKTRLLASQRTEERNSSPSKPRYVVAGPPITYFTSRFRVPSESVTAVFTSKFWPLCSTSSSRCVFEFVCCRQCPVKSGGVCPLTEMAKNKITMKLKARMVMVLSLKIQLQNELHLPGGQPPEQIRPHPAQGCDEDSCQTRILESELQHELHLTWCA
jgi:hypothetical protein